MQKTKSGFTIIELIVVIVIILILSAISIMAYTAVRKNSQTHAADSIARNVMSAAEQYYARNGTYPDALSLANLGGSNTDINKVPASADYSAIATNLGVSSTGLSSSSASLVLCNSSASPSVCGSFTSGYVYYLSRDATGSNNNAQVQFSPGSCTITFNSTTANTADSGASSYAIVYQKASDNSWVYLPSAKTINQTSLATVSATATYNVTISGTGCAWNN
jgi:general secretion pathway protein G